MQEDVHKQLHVCAPVSSSTLSLTGHFEIESAGFQWFTIIKTNQYFLDEGKSVYEVPGAGQKQCIH